MGLLRGVVEKESCTHDADAACCAVCNKLHAMKSYSRHLVTSASTHETVTSKYIS